MICLILIIFQHSHIHKRLSTPTRTDICYTSPFTTLNTSAALINELRSTLYNSNKSAEVSEDLERTGSVTTSRVPELSIL